MASGIRFKIGREIGHAEQQQNAVDEADDLGSCRRQLTLAALRTMTAVIGRPPDQSAEQVAETLGPQFAVGRRDPFQRIQLVDRLQAQQGFEAGDDRQRRRDRVDVRIRRYWEKSG